VAEEAVGLRLRYFDGTSWTDAWDSGASDTLPRAIEVTLALLDPDGTIHRAQTVVAPLAARPSDPIQPLPSAPLAGSGK